MERFFDIFFSVISLLFLFPLFLLIIFILRLTGEGKIFFKQHRVGKGGKVIKVLKFATMLENSPNIGNKTLTVKDDPRILPFGKFLRQTKINELPQLFNVLIGDISLIGPRPLTQENFSLYDKTTQKLIKKVRPGLSGIGSIIFRNEEEILVKDRKPVFFYKNVIAPYKGKLECWFVINKGLKNYFIIIFLTILVILNPKTKIVWKIFKSIPKPPKILQEELNSL